MKKDKLIEFLVSLLKNLKIENKKIKTAIIIAIGLAIGFVSQMNESDIGNDINKLPTSAKEVTPVIQKVIEKGLSDKLGDILNKIL